MALFKSGNPTLSEKRFKDTILDEVVDQGNVMTVKGTLNKFGFLFLMTLGTAFSPGQSIQVVAMCGR